MTENRTCTYCGGEIAEDDVFCQLCGNSVATFVLRAGTVLHSKRYKIIKHISTGGMATIYLGEDLNLGNTMCVIKSMLDDYNDPEERKYAIKKFKEEAIILARLRHSSLPVVQNHFVEKGRYYLVMDYVEGQTLEEILCSTLAKKEFLPEERILNWAIQACDILDYLHNHDPVVIHRDIKPENLMEDKKGGLILLDFGIAHIFDKGDAKTEIGTDGYASPEQYTGKAFPQSDIFALGAVLHRLFTGYAPGEDESNLFRFPLLKEYRQDLTPGLQEIISKATDIDYKKRFSSAKEFKEAIIKLKKRASGILEEEISEISRDKTKDKDTSLIDPYALVMDPLKELERYFLLTLGPGVIEGLKESAEKLGYDKDNFSVYHLESLIEIFSCKYEFTEDIVSEIVKKLQEVKLIVDNEARHYTTVKLEDKEIIYHLEEIEKYLIETVGPVAESVLEEIIKEKGYTRETLPGEEIESVLEIFISKFNLSVEVITEITRKMRELD